MNVNEFKLKQEITSAAQALFGFVVLALVLTGIGGTIYKVIAPDGWVAQAFGRSLSAGVAALGSLAMIAGLAWFSRGWSPSPHRRHRVSGLMVYAFAGAGLLYLARLVLQGTL